MQADSFLVVLILAGRFLLPWAAAVAVPILRILLLKTEYGKLGEYVYQVPPLEGLSVGRRGAPRKRERADRVLLGVLAGVMILAGWAAVTGEMWVGVLLGVFAAGMFLDVPVRRYYGKHLGVYENGVVHYSDILRWTEVKDWRREGEFYVLTTRKGERFSIKRNYYYETLEELLRKRVSGTCRS